MRTITSIKFLLLETLKAVKYNIRLIATIRVIAAHIPFI